MKRSLEAVPWADLTPDDLIRVKATLELQERKPATVNLTLVALRGVARQAWRSGRLTLEDYHRLRDVKGSPATPPLPPLPATIAGPKRPSARRWGCSTSPSQRGSP